MTAVRLVLPNAAMLAEYAAALETGWSPSNTRDVSGEQLEQIRRDPAAFVASQIEPLPPTVTLPDGRVLQRLPGPVYWISDGAFCGVINLRYRPGTLDLPAHVSGHVGYAVVPWKRRKGIATQALRLLLPVAAARGLAKVLVTCDEENWISRRVIEGAGGFATGTAPAPEHGGSRKYLFWLATS